MRRTTLWYLSKITLVLFLASNLLLSLFGALIEEESTVESEDVFEPKSAMRSLKLFFSWVERLLERLVVPFCLRALLLVGA